jgi:hypothetical protein
MLDEIIQKGWASGGVCWMGRGVRVMWRRRADLLGGLETSHSSQRNHSSQRDYDWIVLRGPQEQTNAAAESQKIQKRKITTSITSIPSTPSTTT